MDDQLQGLTTIFTEFYYWVTVAIMFLIHAGFMMYEGGISRRKNVQHTILKNVLVVPLVTITFFLFGWWIYFAFNNGPILTGGLRLDEAAFALPWSDVSGPNMQ